MENTAIRHPNPVVVAIDEGHYMRTVAEKGRPEQTICRYDAEPWPCDRIREARRINAAQYLSLRAAKQQPKKIA